MSTGTLAGKGSTGVSARPVGWAVGYWQGRSRVGQRWGNAGIVSVSGKAFSGIGDRSSRGCEEEIETQQGCGKLIQPQNRLKKGDQEVCGRGRTPGERCCWSGPTGTGGWRGERHLGGRNASLVSDL